jgi:hypothetical protein
MYSRLEGAFLLFYNIGKPLQGAYVSGFIHWALPNVIEFALSGLVGR